MKVTKDNIFIGAKVKDWDEDTGVVTDINNEGFRIEYDNPHIVNLPDTFIRFSGSGGKCELLYIKVKATRLARKLYPDAKEDNGLLTVEA